MDGKPLWNKYKHLKEINPKEQDCESHLSKVIWDRKNYNRVHQVSHFHQNRLASPYDGYYGLQKQTN